MSETPPTDVLPVIGTVIALFAIVVTTALLVCGSHAHAGTTPDSKGNSGSTGEDTAEDVVENTLVSAEEVDCRNSPHTEVHGRHRIVDPTMSDVPDDGNVGDEACANCGKQGSGTIKLKNCNACHLVKYCGVDCQKAHRMQHKKACKQRAAEIKDKHLYSQGHERPEGHFCPICTLPIPLSLGEHSIFNTCCMKLICDGCDFAAKKRGMNDCPFCRTPNPDNHADRLAMLRARVDKKDPVAISTLGDQYYGGLLGLQRNVREAIKLWEEAAELGSIEALHNLGVVYDCGNRVQEDNVQGIQLWTKAAMRGHVESRHNLGCSEAKKGNYNRAKNHFLISAKMGHKRSLEMIKKMFIGWIATKEEYAQALRGYQDARRKRRVWIETKQRCTFRVKPS